VDSLYRILTGLGFLWTQTGLQSSPIPKNCMEYHTNKLDLKSTRVHRNSVESGGFIVGSSKDLLSSTSTSSRWEMAINMLSIDPEKIMT